MTDKKKELSPEELKKAAGGLDMTVQKTDDRTAAGHGTDDGPLGTRDLARAKGAGSSSDTSGNVQSANNPDLAGHGTSDGPLGTRDLARAKGAGAASDTTDQRQDRGRDQNQHNTPKR